METLNSIPLYETGIPVSVVAPSPAMVETELDQEIAKWRAHGELVNAWYQRITSNPSVYFEGDPLVLSWFKSYAAEDLSPYHIHHDMAKPYSKWVCADGKVHYGTDHSLKSSKLYDLVFGPDRFSVMIKNDMAFHRARSETIVPVWNLPDSEHLYATAWAELYANSEMFGGTDSESFKIKKKRLIWALKNKPKGPAPLDTSTFLE